MSFSYSTQKMMETYNFKLMKRPDILDISPLDLGRKCQKRYGSES